jgi:hypothetical protein
VSQLEHLFDAGQSSAEEDATTEEAADDVYMKEDAKESDDGNSDEVASTSTTSRKSSTSARGKRKRTAKHTSRRSCCADIEEGDVPRTRRPRPRRRRRAWPNASCGFRSNTNTGEWDGYFKVYCLMTHQKIVIEETKNREWRLERIRTSKAYRDLKAENCEDEYPLPSEEFAIFQRLYVCTNGGKPKKARGKKQRVRRHLRLYGCEFRFIVQVFQIEDLTWCLEVQLGVFEHHRVGRDVFRTCPDERGVIVDSNGTVLATAYEHFISIDAFH